MKTSRSTSSTSSRLLARARTRSADRRLWLVAAIGFFISCGTTRSESVESYDFRSPAYQQCLGGDLDACAAHAEQAESAGTKAARRSALVAYQYGCFLDHAASCAGLARILGRADTAGTSGERFLEALEAACDGDQPSACAELARRSSGRRAQDLYTRACDANYGPACHELGKIMRQVWKVETQLVSGILLEEKACELGAVEGCIAAGQAYLFGSGIDQNPDHGLELLQRGCSESETAGCETLGQIYRQGIGVAADPEKATRYEDMSTRGAAEKSVGARELAFVVYAEACNRGDALGCFDAAWFRAEGIEIERNLTVARELFTEACNDGLEPACERWKSVDGDLP